MSSETDVRDPVAAGTFYPREPLKLERTVRELLEQADVSSSTTRPLAVIVPHAGCRYSGPVAASAYAMLAPHGGVIRRVALFGPSHFTPAAPCVVSPASAWRTPLGDLEVDDELRDLMTAAGAATDDFPHKNEHSLEVQLPWLQIVVGPSVRILPVVVGACTPTDAASSIAAALELADLIVISTDLSHHLPMEEARARDRTTADAVLARDSEAIGSEDACGLHALRGIVELAYQRSATIELLDLRTSADTAGDPRSVVGYGSFSIDPSIGG